MHTNFGYKKSGLGLVGYFEKNPGTRRILPGNTRKIMYYKKGRAKPFSRGGGEKIKEHNVPGRGTFLARGACKITSRAKRAENFSPPSRVFRPPQDQNVPNLV